MHDLDRSMFEVGGELESHELSAHGEQELEQEDFLGVLGSLLKGEVSQEEETGGVGELQEIELASELLEVGSEAELDRFIGDLMRRAAGAARGFVRSPTARALGGILKQATKQALPVVGQGLGGLVSPALGTFGGRVGQAAGDLLGLELEGLSNEDREFEAARSLVRFMTSACRNAAAASPAAPPELVARSAVEAAARRHAPGLATAGASQDPGGRPGRARSGRWRRQGRTILIFDA
jgi:hypothetical protein